MKFNLPDTNNIAGMVHNAVTAMMGAYKLIAITTEDSEENGPFLMFDSATRTFSVIMDYPKVDQTEADTGYVVFDDAKPVLEFSWDEMLRAIIGLGWDTADLPENLNEVIGHADEESVEVLATLDACVASITELRDRYKLAIE